MKLTRVTLTKGTSNVARPLILVNSGETSSCDYININNNSRSDTTNGLENEIDCLRSECDVRLDCGQPPCHCSSSLSCSRQGTGCFRPPGRRRRRRRLLRRPRSCRRLLRWMPIKIANNKIVVGLEAKRVDGSSQARVFAELSIEALNEHKERVELNKRKKARHQEAKQVASLEENYHLVMRNKASKEVTLFPAGTSNVRPLKRPARPSKSPSDVETYSTNANTIMSTTMTSTSTTTTSGGLPLGQSKSTKSNGRQCIQSPSSSSTLRSLPACLLLIALFLPPLPWPAQGLPSTTSASEAEAHLVGHSSRESATPSTRSTTQSNATTTTLPIISTDQLEPSDLASANTGYKLTSQHGSLPARRQNGHLQSMASEMELPTLLNQPQSLIAQPASATIVPTATSSETKTNEPPLLADDHQSQQRQLNKEVVVVGPANWRDHRQQRRQQSSDEAGGTHQAHHTGPPGHTNRYHQALNIIIGGNGDLASVSIHRTNNNNYRNDHDDNQSANQSNSSHSFPLLGGSQAGPTSGVGPSETWPQVIHSRNKNINRNENNSHHHYHRHHTTTTTTTTTSTSSNTNHHAQQASDILEPAASKGQKSLRGFHDDSGQEHRSAGDSKQATTRSVPLIGSLALQPGVSSRHKGESEQQEQLGQVKKSPGRLLELGEKSTTSNDIYDKIGEQFIGEPAHSGLTSALDRSPKLLAPTTTTTTTTSAGAQISRPSSQLNGKNQIKSSLSPSANRIHIDGGHKSDDDHQADEHHDESSRIGRALADEHHLNVDDYDQLFVLHDFRRCTRRSPLSLSPLKPADESPISDHKRRSARSYTDKTSKVQTIYFGGFFPWLADENTAGAFLADQPSQLEQHQPDSQATNLNVINRPRGQPQPVGAPPLAADTGEPGMAKQHNNHHHQQRRRAKLQRQTPVNSTLIGRQHQPPASHHNQQQHQDNMSATAAALQAAAAAVAAIQSTGQTAQYTSESRHQLGRFILPAVRLALDHINTNKSVLAPYKLEVVPRDTQCNATISLKQFFDMVYEEPKKMLLYGDACRVSTDPIAKASYFFDLIQISYADTDPIYTIENYPNFFRVVPSENALSLARIPFIQHFNWTRVGTIYQNLPRYSLPHSKLLTDLERFNIVTRQSVSLPGSVDGLQNRDLSDELRKLKERDVRIILGNFDEEWALLLFCEAYREKMIGRKYQWLLTGFGEAKLWQLYETKGSSCTKQELLVAMDGYIITDITAVTRSQNRTVSGMMAHEYSDEYKRRAREMNIPIEENKFYGYVYDGIWAIALALNRIDHLLKYYQRLASEKKVIMKPGMENINSLLDFEYHKPVWVKLIRDALNRTQFEGVTGTVSFEKNERPGLITYFQFQAFRDENEVIIGSYDALRRELDLKVGFPVFWRGSSPPIDHTIQRVTPFRINRTIFVIISIMAILGIILAFTFLFVNIKFRNQRYIKMSSPYLNNLIIIGCILTFTSVIILGLDSGLTSEFNFPYICNARAWVLMAGFTLAFGSMFSKTYRVHSIFTNIKLHKKNIKDLKLFVVVFILLTFDIIILIIWQYVDPFYRETNNGISIQDPDNEDILIVPEMEHCQSKRMTVFLTIIYVYKGLLMAFGCFLAWETRHVSIPALNDSKYIGLSVYNVVIMCVIGASLSFVLRDQQDASFVIISIFIIFCSTATLCLVFVPKVRMLIELKQNPRAGEHRVRATLKTFKKNYHDEALGAAAGCRDIHGNVIGRGYGMPLNDKIKLMLEESVKQRSLLKEKTFELEALTSKYRKIQSMVQSGQYLQAINTSSASPQALQAGSSSMNQLTGSTTMLLTSRSPTRERVSFSALKDDKLPPTALSHQVEAPTQARSTADKHPTIGVLYNSPLMSSITQITNTNTTSSTTTASNNNNNNNTDPTDYSSSKMISTTTTTTSASDQRKSFDELEGRNHLANSKTAEIANKRGILKQADQSKSQKGPMGQSYEGLNLFTLLQYMSDRHKSNDNLNGKQMQSQQLRNQQEAHRRPSLAKHEAGQWLEGPFCTMMIRQASLDSKQFRAGVKKQTSQQDNSVRGESTGSQASLPRSLSMIEYLGLTEFDQIARRHDKISRFKRQRHHRLDCCFESTSCTCCSSHPNHHHHHHHHHNHPGGAPNFAHSISEPLNSDDLLQTSVSCSTCCSLTSQAYGSQSELDEHQSSPSMSSRTISSSLSRSSSITNRRPYFSESQTSSSSSSGSSDSSSTSNLDQNTRLTHLCHHHHHQQQQQQMQQQRVHSNSPNSHLHHPHHHHHHHQLPDGQAQPLNQPQMYGSLQMNPHHKQHVQAHLHQVGHHRRHQQQLDSSAELMSSASSSSAIRTATTTAAPPTPSSSIREPQSLCTSGVLYGSPSSKEDANEAAHISRPLDGEPVALVGELILEPNDNNSPVGEKTTDDPNEDQMQKQISIKCDVLESL